jgi:ADP-heptose:LPS heptosyltransferase
MSSHRQVLAPFAAVTSRSDCDSQGYRASSDSVERVAVFQALNLGDLLCSTPALRALRRHFPDSEITFIGRPWASDLVARFGIECFAPFPGYPGIAESPRTAAPFPEWPKFDYAVQMHGSGGTSNGFVATLAARHAVGFGPPDETRLTTSLLWVDDEPEPLRWLRLVDGIGVPAAGHELDFPFTPAEQTQAAALLGPSMAPLVVGLHVGASDPARRWPVSAFAQLGGMLAARTGARIVLTGAEAERPLTAAVRNQMTITPVDLAGKTSLGELAAVVANLDLLVTNDTGVSHVAAATGTPSVVLFGPTRPARWAPLDRKLHRVIDACSLRGAPEDGAAALRALSVECVFAVCEAILAGALVRCEESIA